MYILFYSPFRSHPYVTTKLILKRVDSREGSTKEAQHLP